MNQHTITAAEILAVTPPAMRDEVRAAISTHLFFQPTGSVSERGREAAADLVEAIMGDPCEVISDHLRSKLAEAFDLSEQEPAPWLVPGAEVFQPGRGPRGVWSKVLRVEPAEVILLPLFDGAAEERSHVVGFVNALEHRAPSVGVTASSA